MLENATRDIAGWLAELGLSQYAPAFARHAVDLKVLRKLSNDDLKEMGVALGHRKTILEALARLDDAQPAAPIEAERRQLTVMFCDMVGSTELSSRLDPEDLRDVIRLFQNVCTEVVVRYGGFIAAYPGDGILIYFGYPRAYEDAAERAVRAGLEMIETVARTTGAGGERIRIRLGAATGVAVVGDLIGRGAAEQVAATGRIPNLAARLQTVGNPGELVIADSTRKLVGGLFEYEDLGLQSFKGIEGEVHVWRVARECANAARYEALRGTGPEGFVGRDKELAFLRERWERAVQGEGHVVLLSGEAGIGKSSLIRHFQEGLEGVELARVPLQCSARHSNTPLYPLIVHLQRVAGIDARDPPETKLEKIERMLPTPGAREEAALLAALLSIPSADRYPPLAMPAKRQKALTFALVANHAIELARRSPVLMLVEDAHWIDPTTDELSNELIDLVRDRRILVVIAARPEYSPSWIDRSCVSTIHLARLGQPDTQRLVERVTGGKALPSGVMEQILAKADGVPLFAEELTKAVLESGLLKDIPLTLQDSLMARLDHQGTVKEIAQVGAAIGRKFSFAMLAAVTGQPLDRLTDALARLEGAELIIAHGRAPDAEYTFKHALVQDAAYESLLRATKKALHLRIAEALEARFPEIVETEPEALAHHWTRADHAGKAARYWLKAGQRAVARSANVEAIRHLRNGIEIVDRVAEDDERGLLEFNLQLSLGQAAYVTKGPAAQETTVAYSRAQALVEEVGDPEQRFTLLYGIFSGYHFASRFKLAEEPAARFFELATRNGDTGHLCQAHRMLGYLDFFRGDLKGAVGHFTRLAELYEPERHGRLAYRYGADCLIASRGFQILCDCFAGSPESAIRMGTSNLEYAKRLGHPATLGWAYASTSYLYYYVRDYDAAARVSAEGVQFCEKNDVGAWVTHCRIFNAWARAQLSEPADRAADIKQAIVEAGAGTTLGLPMLRGVLAEVLTKAGDAQAAVKEAELALTEVVAMGQHFFHPVLLQIHGDSLLALPAPQYEAAAECYRKSIAMARHMGARLLELRAATRFAALALNSDNADELRETVAALYGRFDEGFEMPDLRAAREFLTAGR